MIKIFNLRGLEIWRERASRKQACELGLGKQRATLWPVRRRSHVDGGSLPRLRVVVAAGLVFISVIIRSEAMDGERKFAGGWWSDNCWLVWM